MEEKYNPWAVQDISAFQFYNCPECDVKEKDAEAFRDHALRNHERSKDHPDALQYHHHQKDEEVKEPIEPYDPIFDDTLSDPDFNPNQFLNDEEPSQSPSTSKPVIKKVPVKKQAKVKREFKDTDFIKQEDSDDNEDEEPVLKKPRPDFHSQCYYCGLILFGEENMVEHISKTHNQFISAKMYGERRDYQCIDCLRMFKKPESLELHICEIVPMSWLGPDAKSQKCPKCDKEFDDYGQLLCHHDLEHKKEKNASCRHAQCDFIGESLVQLSDHEVEKHRHECEFCFKTFYSRNALLRHNLQCFDENLPVYESPECFYCGLTLQTEAHLETHKIMSHKKPMMTHEIKCRLCDYVAPTKWLLKNHRKKDHSPVCNVCGKDCKDQAGLTYHMETVHVNAKSILCELCDYRCNMIRQLVNHKKRVHDKELNHFCDTCGKGFFNLDSLGNHIKTKHETEWKYKCDRCHKEFKTANDRNRHKRTTHEKFTICTKCDKMFVGYKKLRVHLNTDHEIFNTKNDVRLCPHCDRRFEKTADINEHLHLDHGMDKTSFCARCSDAFVSRTILTSHLMEIHEFDPSKEVDGGFLGVQTGKVVRDKMSKDFRCNICDLYFRSSRTLNDHHKQKHQKESHAHFCDVCEWSTFEAARLRKHWRAMHAEKNFRCDKCDFKTSIEATLNRHKKKIHLKAELYSCEECGQQFTIKDSLAKHCMNEHRILMTWKRSLNKQL